MTYGQNPYGRTPWGGSPASDDISLIFTNPAQDQTGVPVSFPIQFIAYTASDFNVTSLAVQINGVPAIVGGSFQPTFSGAISTTTGHLNVSINHPNLTGGTLAVVQIDVENIHALVLSASFSFHVGEAQASVSETLSIVEAVNLIGLTFVSINGTTIQGSFPVELSLDQITAATSFTFVPSPGAVPLVIESITPMLATRQTGSHGQVVQIPKSVVSKQFNTTTGAFIAQNVGDYLYINAAASIDQGPYRIESTAGSVVTLDRPVLSTDLGNGSLSWTHTGGVIGVTIKTNKSTSDKNYGVILRGLKLKQGQPFDRTTDFVAYAEKPRAESAEFVSENGTVIVNFDYSMRLDPVLVSPSEYTITGPSGVSVTGARVLSDSSVALSTTGFSSGLYTLTVNATGTPKDVAGNPIDPLFNEAVFMASIPLINRSIFTDKGPIAKPELTISVGSGGTIQTSSTTYFGNVTLNEVVLAGGAFTSSHVGKYIALSDSTVNAGDYKISAVLSANRLRLEANLRLPDPANGSLTWRLFDPRTGEVADDPSDVVVRVNGFAVTPEAVVGLLGQVILSSEPSDSDDVQVDYTWIPDPSVELRRLNSKEFKLNGWLTDSGRQGPTQHSYRYRNVLVSPSTFESEELLAEQEQPLLRELHYRAFERAYSVALNDPNLLLLNTPFHRISYPPLSRTVEQESISYAGDVLPEVDTSPWERKGLGVASIVSGNLVVQDNTDGPYPTGNPLFWTRGTDLSFPHVFAMTWRMTLNSSTPDGVFTGIAAGWSDTDKAVVVGFLSDGGTRKIGFLRRGQEANPSTIGSWMGGISGGSATDLPVSLDWSVLHSYRILQSIDGVIRLYVDGDVTETLRATADELALTSELEGPLDEVQEVFFGSMSREAVNVSTWDFVRYLVLPTNPSQTTPSIFVSYEADELPAESPALWTTIGSHGNEMASGGVLVLDSTSVTAFSGVGLIGGDFKGYTRIEPLLASSSDVDLDFEVQLRTYTHGIANNAVTVALDDSDRLIQVSFFPTKSQPKISYPGRSLPQDATPRPWTSLGAATASIVDQTLVIDDTLLLDGRVFAIEDLEPSTGDNRIVGVGLDYYVEFKLKVESYTADGNIENFCGATVDVFDGTRAVGVMIRQAGLGARQLAFHSDGLLLGGVSQFDFEWFDSATHVVRMVKNTLGNLVSLFVDGVLLGSLAYSSFSTSVGTPTISFGSSTATSSAAKSKVDWHYVNVWRGQPTTGVRRYVGIWKGYDVDALTGYHLPLKTSGQAQVAGNALTDPMANFVASGVSVGDDLVVDVGTIKGVYSVASVSTSTITITEIFPSTPSVVGYRVPSQVDWTSFHKYRLVRDSGGAVSLLLDSIVEPIIRIDYNVTTLPPSSLGFPYQINSGLPSVSWGAFDPMNLSQTAWDFVHYGVVNSASVAESRIVPPHQVLNQRNVMSSPEHLSGSVVHDHTQFSSSSTGVPYPWFDYVSNPSVVAFTKLNEGTPLVPSTQTYEVRRPTPTVQFLAGLNRPEDVLNGSGFLLNDGTTEIRLVVPNDVLYNTLEVVEQTTGSTDFLAPFSDESNPIALRQLSWQKEVCGTYAGDVLPELDSSFGTPWVLESDVPGSVSTTSFSGALTYTAGPSGNTIYRNETPLTDSIGLSTKVEFRLRVLNDTSGGTGDTGIRFGFSAFGTITAALAFVSGPFGDREVRLLDLATNHILGAIQFDFLDGSYHVYQLIKNIEDGTVDFLIDP